VRVGFRSLLAKQRRREEGRGGVGKVSTGEDFHVISPSGLRRREKGIPIKKSPYTKREKPDADNLDKNLRKMHHYGSFRIERRERGRVTCSCGSLLRTGRKMLKNRLTPPGN